MKTFFSSFLATWFGSLIERLAGFQGFILLFFVGGAGLLGYGLWLKQSTAKQIADLQPISGYDLDRSEAGRQVLVIGHTSPQNPALFREFIAYIATTYRGRDEDGKEIWKEVERQAPPLWVVMADGPILIQSYQQKNGHQVWQTTPKPQRGGRNQATTLRYSGLLPNTPIVAIGTVVRKGAERMVEAEFLFGGSLEDYLAFVQRDVRDANLVGLIWLGMGVGLQLLYSPPGWLKKKRPKKRSGSGS